MEDSGFVGGIIPNVDFNDKDLNLYLKEALVEMNSNETSKYV